MRAACSGCAINRCVARCRSSTILKPYTVRHNGTSSYIMLIDVVG